LVTKNPKFRPDLRDCTAFAGTFIDPRFTLRGDTEYGLFLLDS
jgi:hypothetical protein